MCECESERASALMYSTVLCTEQTLPSVCVGICVDFRGRGGCVVSF